MITLAYLTWPDAVVIVVAIIASSTIVHAVIARIAPPAEPPAIDPIDAEISVTGSREIK